MQIRQLSALQAAAALVKCAMPPYNTITTHGVQCSVVQGENVQYSCAAAAAAITSVAVNPRLLSTINTNVQLKHTKWLSSPALL